jgi:hypothetical protein
MRKYLRDGRRFLYALPLWFLLVSGTLLQAQTAPTVIIDWTKTTPNRTTPTLQAVVNPMLRRGSPIHDAALRALNRLAADYVRYAFWFPYPRLVVAELKPPESGQTFWDFQYLDPLVADFAAASGAHPMVWSFSTIPQWMFTTDAPVSYPDDPNQVFWDYSKGSELRDLTALGDYYGRLAAWYARGGFTDELGKFHSSAHHYPIDYWEVFNEVDSEHKTGAEDYVRRYDAVVEAVRKAVPGTKFVGLSLEAPSDHPEMFEYFLNPKNHRPGVPLDYISFHFYAVPTRDQGLSEWQYSFFDRADRFLATTRYILAIRDRLSPQTKIMINEVGTILTSDFDPDDLAHIKRPIPADYWNLSGAMFAYLYVQLAKLGVDVLGESQLVGFPTQFPSVSMIDWTTGEPNARFSVLELLKNNFAPGDEMPSTDIKGGPPGDADAIQAQAFVRGKLRKLLLINKRNREISIQLPKECAGASLESIANGPAPDKLSNPDEIVRLPPLSVSVIKLKILE